MQMVATVPNPPTVTEPPPRIQTLVHNGAGKLLRPGDNLKVVLIGDRGKIAKWSISPFVTDLAMQEKEPGVYIGAYRIEPKDRMPNGRLVGYLSSETGTASQWVDILGPIKIGEPTLLPAIISRDTILSIDNSPYLVEEALLILPQAKLTVNPGTVIWFHKLGLIARGQLQISGTEADPVQLAGIGTSRWKGVFLDQSRSRNTVSFCKISDAEFGFRASKSNISIQNSLFQNNAWGIVLEDSTARIQNSLVRTSDKTGISARKTSIRISGSTITENNSGGILLEGSPAQIEQNNIMNNGKWELKAEGSDAVEAGHNWWGKENPDKTEIIGPITYRPMLEGPVEFKMFE
jgi:hypothetical protein